MNRPQTTNSAAMRVLQTESPFLQISKITITYPKWSALGLGLIGSQARHESTSMRSCLSDIQARTRPQIRVDAHRLCRIFCRAWEIYHADQGWGRLRPCQTCEHQSRPTSFLYKIVLCSSKCDSFREKSASWNKYNKQHDEIIWNHMCIWQGLQHSWSNGEGCKCWSCWFDGSVFLHHLDICFGQWIHPLCVYVCVPMEQCTRIKNWGTTGKIKNINSTVSLYPYIYPFNNITICQGKNAEKQVTLIHWHIL